MSALSVFAPRRFGRMFFSDAMNVSRDPTLIFATFLSVVPGVAFSFGHRSLDVAMLDTFGIAAFSRYLVPVALCLPAFLVGWVCGFLFLEDRDEGTLTALDVTPVGKAGFMSYRVAVTTALAALVTLLGAWLVMPDAGAGLTVLLAVLVALEAIAGAFILPAVARNKVDGLAVTKLTNLAAVAPLLAAIPSPWRFLAAPIPTFWVGEILGMSGQRLLPGTVTAALALIVHLAVAAVLYRLMRRRAG